MKYLYSNKHWPINKEYNLDKLLFLMVDRPSRINNVVKYYIWTNKKNQNHRNYDLPTEIDIIENISMKLYWDINGKRHRKNNKPSYIDYNGYKEYSINGQVFRREQLK